MTDHNEEIPFGDPEEWQNAHSMPTQPRHTAPKQPTVYVQMYFNLDDPDGERRLRECLDAPFMREAVRDFNEWLNEWLRAEIKHKDHPPEVYAMLIEARDQLHAELIERNLSVWE